MLLSWKCHSCVFTGQSQDSIESRTPRSKCLLIVCLLSRHLMPSPPRLLISQPPSEMSGLAAAPIVMIVVYTRSSTVNRPWESWHSFNQSCHC